MTDASVVSDHAGLCGEVVHVERDADVALLHGMRRFGCWSAAPAGPAAPGGPAVPAAERPGPVEGARA